jgi:hypothetical protein
MSVTFDEDDDATLVQLKEQWKLLESPDGEEQEQEQVRALCYDKKAAETGRLAAEGARKELHYELGLIKEQYEREMEEHIKTQEELSKKEEELNLSLQKTAKLEELLNADATDAPTELFQKLITCLKRHVAGGDILREDAAAAICGLETKGDAASEAIKVNEVKGGECNNGPTLNPFSLLSLPRSRPVTSLLCTLSRHENTHVSFHALRICGLWSCI